MPLPCVEARFSYRPVESYAPQKSPTRLRCAAQTVRNAIHAFAQKGLDCLKQESSRPKTVPAPFDQAKCEVLRALLHQGSRIFGKASSCWTLELAAEVCFEQGLTMSQVMKCGGAELSNPTCIAGENRMSRCGELELAATKNDPDPKALACYGMLSADSGRMYSRFVSGRPVSKVTTDDLEWL